MDSGELVAVSSLVHCSNNSCRAQPLSTMLSHSLIGKQHKLYEYTGLVHRARVCSNQYKIRMQPFPPQSPQQTQSLQNNHILSTTVTIKHVQIMILSYPIRYTCHLSHSSNIFAWTDILPQHTQMYPMKPLLLKVHSYLSSLLNQIRPGLNTG